MPAVDPFKQDPQLLERFRAGAPDALERVYRAFLRPLRRFVLRGFAFKSEGRDLYFRGTLTSDVLDDVIQETFRRAYGAKARAAYDGVRPYKNYLFTIARNAVMNELLSARRHVPVGDTLERDAGSEELPPIDRAVRAHLGDEARSAGAMLDLEIERIEIHSILKSFQSELDDPDRALFHARFVELLSQEQAARALGWNRARVRKVEARLRRDLLEELQGTGYLERHPEARRARRAGPTPLHTAARALWRATPSEGTIDLLSAA